VRNISFADHIIVLGDDGSVTEQGSYSELSTAGGYLESLQTEEKITSSTNLAEDTLDADTRSTAPLVPKANDDSRRTGDLTIYKYYFDTIGWLSWGIFVFLSSAFVFALIFPRTYTPTVLVLKRCPRLSNWQKSGSSGGQKQMQGSHTLDWLITCRFMQYSEW
jgi:ATP-binding cassette, subfamily C (CFTR/MRP), member 1